MVLLLMMLGCGGATAGGDTGVAVLVGLRVVLLVLLVLLRLLVLLE